MSYYRIGLNGRPEKVVYKYKVVIPVTHTITGKPVKGTAKVYVVPAGHEVFFYTKKEAARFAQKRIKGKGFYANSVSAEALVKPIDEQPKLPDIIRVFG